MEESQRKLISMYKEIEEFLISDVFKDDLRLELQKLKPDYQEVLRKRRKDMEKIDNAIVFAGRNLCANHT